MAEAKEEHEPLAISPGGMFFMKKKPDAKALFRNIKAIDAKLSRALSEKKPQAEIDELLDQRGRITEALERAGK